MEHSFYTARLGRILTNTLKEKVGVAVKVFYDHGRRAETNVCKPTSYFDECSRVSTLSHIDIAILGANEREIFLCEIEEEGASPKKIIGDVIALLLAEGIRIKNRDYLLKNFNKIYFFLGIKAEEKSKSAVKADELRARLQEIIKPKYLNKISIEFIFGADYDTLISNIERNILAMLGVIG